MVTVEKQNNAYGTQAKTSFEFRGLSDDEKPGDGTGKYLDVDIANGSVFIEMDTQTVLFFDEENSTWVGGGEEE